LGRQKGIKVKVVPYSNRVKVYAEQAKRNGDYLSGVRVITYYLIHQKSKPLEDTLAIVQAVNRDVFGSHYAEHKIESYVTATFHRNQAVVMFPVEAKSVQSPDDVLAVIERAQDRLKKGGVSL